jgi:hypothetical protein
MTRCPSSFLMLANVALCQSLSGCLEMDSLQCTMLCRVLLHMN